jgi:hypothetical protein
MQKKKRNYVINDSLYYLQGIHPYIIEPEEILKLKSIYKEKMNKLNKKI